ncbi:MAG: hypothetical protein WCQ96_02035 [Patescibacteria group bacterium]
MKYEINLSIVHLMDYLLNSTGLVIVIYGCSDPRTWRYVLEKAEEIEVMFPNAKIAPIVVPGGGKSLMDDPFSDAAKEAINKIRVVMRKIKAEKLFMIFLPHEDCGDYDELKLSREGLNSHFGKQARIVPETLKNEFGEKLLGVITSIIHLDENNKNIVGETGLGGVIIV